MTLTPDLLLNAYCQGFFPMASGDNPSQKIYWYQPERRGLLPIAQFHIPKRLKPILHKHDYTITLNADFLGIITACATGSLGKERRNNTWINDDIITAYHSLHRLGFAHSLEVYNKAQQLIGGIYGVAIGGAFFAESMFSNHTNGSKIALTYLAAHLYHQGFTLFDTQYLTPHLKTFGGYECTHADYLRLLEKALALDCAFIPSAPQSSGISSSAPSGSALGAGADLSAGAFSLSPAVLSPLLHSKTHTS
jgi:leucyl/phenylalanyl-tRNA--protein transferase